MSKDDMIAIDGIAVHASITTERVISAVEAAHTSLDNPGFCIGCGAEADGVEPDARCYECEACGAPLVYGAEELMFHIAL